MPVILYGCETWFLTLWEEHRLRVFQNSVLREIVGPKWDEVTGKCERTCNEELHELCFSPDIIWVIKVRRMICVGERRGIYRAFMMKPERKIPLVRPRHRWEDNIEIYLFQIWSLCSSQLHVISAVSLQLRQ